MIDFKSYSHIKVTCFTFFSYHDTILIQLSNKDFRMKTTNREVIDFNSDHMVKKVNKNTCTILAQCLYLGHSIEWANSVNEISELVNHELSLETLAKIISTEEARKISTNVWFKREDGHLSGTVVKHGNMGIKRKIEVKVNIPKEDILRDTGRTNGYIKNEYDHTPFILSLAIFLGESIEWANAINEAV